MIIFPAVDMRRGKCVRLVQGRAEDETVYSEDPLVVARQWCEQGASWLHLVDLDGAMVQGGPQPEHCPGTYSGPCPSPCSSGAGCEACPTYGNCWKREPPG